MIATTTSCSTATARRRPRSPGCVAVGARPDPAGADGGWRHPAPLALVVPAMAVTPPRSAGFSARRSGRCGRCAARAPGPAGAAPGRRCAPRAAPPCSASPPRRGRRAAARGPLRVAAPRLHRDHRPGGVDLLRPPRRCAGSATGCRTSVARLPRGERRPRVPRAPAGARIPVWASSCAFVAPAPSWPAPPHPFVGCWWSRRGLVIGVYPAGRPTAHGSCCSAQLRRALGGVGLAPIHHQGGAAGASSAPRCLLGARVDARRARPAPHRRPLHASRWSSPPPGWRPSTASGRPLSTRWPAARSPPTGPEAIATAERERHGRGASSNRRHPFAAYRRGNTYEPITAGLRRRRLRGASRSLTAVPDRPTS